MPEGGALSTPVIPASQAGLTLSASTLANAQASLCLDKIIDTSVWKDWNRLVPEVKIRHHLPQEDWMLPVLCQTNPRIAAAVLPSEVIQSLTQGDLDFYQNNIIKELGPQYLRPTAQLAGRLGLSSFGIDPSVRLRLATQMKFHVVLGRWMPNRLRKMSMVVKDLTRPKTRPPAGKAVYRIMWENTALRKFPHGLPKRLLFSQQVTEIREFRRSDGKTCCEIRTWACLCGLLVPLVRLFYGRYLQTMFEQYVQGLSDYCESMGGAVDRRDFAISDGV